MQKGSTYSILNEIWNRQIISGVGDQNTDPRNGKRPFEERVFARFDAVDSRLNTIDGRFEVVAASILTLDSRLKNLEGRADDTISRLKNLESRADDTNSRLQKLEIRAYDTKPIWEQALKEIVDTRREMSKRLARIEAVVYETRSDLRDVEDRLEQIETKPSK